MLRPSVFILILWCGIISVSASAQDFTITRIATPIHNQPRFGFNQGIVVSDFSHSGNLDIAMVTSGSPSTSQVVTVLKGKPDGTFETGVQYDTGFSSVMVVAGDFNGDGKTDLAVPNASGGVVFPARDGDISLLLGKGDSIFQAAKSVPAPVPIPNQTFPLSNPSWLGAADFDNDGITDLVVTFVNSKEVGVMIANHSGNATFSTSFSASLTQNPTWAGTGDFDGDHNQDFAVVLADGTVRLWLGAGNGNFTAKGPFPLGAGGTPMWGLIYDLDADGRLDIAVTSSVKGTISVLYGDGQGGFAAPYVIGIGDAPAGLAAADFDGDGHADLAVGISPPPVIGTVTTSGWKLGILHANVGVDGLPDRTFKLPGSFFDGGPNPGLIGVGDFNHDLLPDIAVTNWMVNTSADVSILTAKPNGSGSGIFVGSLAQIAVEGGWDTLLTMVNNGSSPAAGHIDFFGDNGNPVAFPMTVLPASGPPPAPSPVSSLDQTLNPGASVVIDGTGPGGNLVTGWARELASGNVGVFGIFRLPSSKWEAVVPLETRNAESYVLAFDYTGTLATGVAVADVSAQAASIPVIIRDDTGTRIATGTISLPGHGHTSFVLSTQYPIVIGKRGTVEFDTPSGGQISVLGLRANGPALTTLPVLANVGTNGGSITHATYNGGFVSIFYIVNMGNSAPFTLSFFDEHGGPLSVPLLLPQDGTTVTASTLTRTLAAKAMLVVQTQSQSAPDAVVGSAQLTTTGNVSGFEIFQWTTFGQEASVPLETRRPNAFVLVFDNTNGLTTGVALANLTGTAGAVTVNLRDDIGAVLQTSAVNLAGFGHTSFLLPDVFTAVAGKRGVVEFVPPAGGQISAIGLRAKNDGTLTTIPVLIK